MIDVECGGCGLTYSNEFPRCPKCWPRGYESKINPDTFTLECTGCNTVYSPEPDAPSGRWCPKCWDKDHLPGFRRHRPTEAFPTGSVRDTRQGKGRYDLLPAKALHRVARRYEEGAAHYGDRNWEKGQPISRIMDSLLRHAFQYLDGNQGEDHIAAVAWNALAVMQMEETLPEMQDLETRKTA